MVQQPRLSLGRGGRRYETSPEAYGLYLRARAMEIQDPAGARNRNVRLYEQTSVRTLPSHRTGEDRVNWSGLGRAEKTATMRTIVQKALELDPF